MFKKLICTTALVALASCGGGSGSSPTSYHSSGITGVVQKGPLIYGSYVNAYLLDENLNPTGQSYVTRTTDDLGNFTISSNISSSLVELIATGYYFDELTGSLSTSPTTLSAIVDLTVNPTPTINVLTTLQEPRIKALLASGKTYSEAMQQSAKEVLSVFGVDAEKIEGYQSLYGMQINGNKDADSVLLAASTILGKMSTTATVGTASSQAAQLSYFLSRIASDVANYGTLKESSIKTAISNAQSAITLATVRTNVESYYSSRGISLVAPKFEEWIDKSNSGILPQRRLPVTSLTFTETTTETNSSVTSNSVRVSGLGDGIVAQVSIDGSSTNLYSYSAHNNWKIVKNNTVLSDSYTTAVNGDELSIQLTADRFGDIVTTNLHVGSTTASWNVTTRKPNIVYANQNFSVSGSCSGGLSSHNYYAFPFKTNVASAVNYLGFGVGASSAPDFVSIYSDSGGQPGTALVTTNAITPGANLFADNSTGYTFTDGTAYSDTRFSYPQAQISKTADTFSIEANTIYWIVMKWDNKGTPICNFSKDNPLGNLGFNYGMNYSDDGVSWGHTSYTQIPGFFLAN